MSDTAGLKQDTVASTPIQVILEIIEEARRVKFGTVILSRHMAHGDFDSYYNKGIIFSQFLASDLQLWTNYFDANRSTPEMAGLRSELSENADGLRVTIRLAPPAVLNNHPDPRAMGLGSPGYCALLPRQRHSHEAQGRVLFLPYTGLTVFPVEMGSNGGWHVEVAEDTEHYKRGGYRLWIGKEEIETAIERQLAPVDRTILEGGPLCP